jgi:glycosyltransferase involved in cell wall biosynthesis
VAQLARVRGVPYVISPRGVLVRELLRRKSYWVKTFWLRAFDARSLAGAARIHVTSDTELRELSAFGLRIAATILAPNGVDTPPVLAADGGMLELSEPYGLFLGRISWKKGLDRALRALVHTQARLLIVGGDDEGLQPALEREALQLGVTERIEFLGQRDGAQKWQLLRNARFLILPSYNENFGNVVAEAMAVRCPVIVTPEVGAAEIVRRAGAGIVAEGDAATLGAAMERLWTRGEDREQFGFAGAEYVREHLSWDAIARVFAQEYAEILRASGR